MKNKKIEQLNSTIDKLKEKLVESKKNDSEQLERLKEKLFELESIRLKQNKDIVTQQDLLQKLKNRIEDIENSWSYKFGFGSALPLRWIADKSNNREFVAKPKTNIEIPNIVPLNYVLDKSIIENGSSNSGSSLEAQIEMDSFPSLTNVWKPKVLYICPDLPDHDSSSGGKRSYRILEILSKKYNTSVFTLGKKKEKYVDALNDINVSVICKDLDRSNFNPNILDTYTYDLSRFDVLIYAWYNTYNALHHLRRFNPTAKIVVDTVDVHWVREKRQVLFENKKISKAELAHRKANELSIYDTADVVWAVSHTDKKYINDELPFKQVEVVSNVHDNVIDKYKEKDSQNILFFGGYKHEPNIPAVKRLVNEILPLVNEILPQLRITIAGSSAPDDVIDLAENKNVDYIGYVEEEDLVKLYEESSCAVIPLLSGAGIKGKICEAIVHRLPVITNSIGNEGIDLEYGVDGFVCETNQDFADTIVEFFQNKYDLDKLTEKAQVKLQSIVGTEVVRTNVTRSISPQVNICIVTYNKVGLLKRCVESVLKNTSYPYYKILVYSNGCKDGTKEYLEEISKSEPRVIPMISETNKVFVIPNNEMMLRDDSDVVLLNNDTYVTKDWLTNLYKSAYSSCNIGIAGSKILYPDGKLQEFGSELFPNYSGNNIGKFDNPDKEQYSKLEKRGYVSGCSMYIKRSTINKIGVFDERFHPCYCEDSDMCYTAWEKGLQTVVVPNSVIYHDEGGTSGSNDNVGFKMFQKINFLKFNQKHQGKLNNINWYGDKIEGKQILQSADLNYKDVFGQRLLNGTQTNEDVFPIANFDSFKSRKEYTYFTQYFNDVLLKRREVEKIVFHYLPGENKLPGRNPISKNKASFLMASNRSAKVGQVNVPILKDALLDDEYSLNSKERALTLLVHESSKVKKKFLLLEGNTHLSKALQELNSNVETLIDSSIYFDLDEKSYSVANLSKGGLKKSYDLVVSNDDIQFYPDPKKYLQILFNGLKKKGELILSLPFRVDMEETEILGEMINNNLKVHKELLMDKNKYMPDSQMVSYNIFGWDILDTIKEIGFSKVSINKFWSLKHGVLGDDFFFIKANK